MMLKHSYIFLLLILFFNCSDHSDSSDVTKEIKALDNHEKQSNYLENIYKLDQEIRQKLNEVERNYSYNSPQVEEVYREMSEIDEINLLKIERYLELKGHPDKKMHSELAVSAPFIVYHHNTKESVRKRGFRHLFKAYLEENIDGDRLAFYLNRSYYDISNGQRITWNRPYRVEEELDTLYQVLNLLPIIDEIKNSN